jgi:hypothetical protein
MTVALYTLDQHRQQGLEPLAANTISRLPQQRRRLAHCLVVGPLTWSRPLWHQWVMQYTQCVFAVIAGHPGELVEDRAAFPPARRPITFSHRLLEFLPCCHAQRLIAAPTAAAQLR